MNAHLFDDTATSLSSVPSLSRRQIICKAGAAALLGTIGVAVGIGAGAKSGFLPKSVDWPITIPPVLFLAASEMDQKLYQAFSNRFVTAGGRVIDTGNNYVSHTEGQGLGMLFAVMFDDRVAFESIYDWTHQNLSRAEDALYSWRYDPYQLNHVSDTNNASDGDIFIASALWRAGSRWNVPAYIEAAQSIAQDILQLLVVQAGARTLLLPAKLGFQHLHSITVNMSYYCFPLLRDLAQAVPSPVWAALEVSALELIDQGRFGKWMLPPDWLTISLLDGTLTPSPRFSYDAIRIPLHLSWANISLVEVQKAFMSFWNATKPDWPAWVDLHSGEVAPYGYSPGMRAVEAIACGTEQARGFRSLQPITDATDYFSATLTLLSFLSCSG